MFFFVFFLNLLMLQNRCSHMRLRVLLATLWKALYIQRTVAATQTEADNGVTGSKGHFPGQIIKFPGAREHLAGGEQCVIPHQLATALTLCNGWLGQQRADPTSDH